MSSKLKFYVLQSKLFDTINKVKRELKEQEKIYASHIFQKGLVARIYKEILQLKNKKTAQFKNGWRIRVDISTEKMYELPVSTEKDAECC